jgi:hypothetical protein
MGRCIDKCNEYIFTEEFASRMVFRLYASLTTYGQLKIEALAYWIMFFPTDKSLQKETSAYGYTCVHLLPAIFYHL